MKTKQPTPKQPKKQQPSQNTGQSFSRFFTHWRSGKILDAWEYGYKAWPIGGKA